MHKTCPASLSMAIWVTFGAMGAPALAQGFPQDWSHRQVRFSHPGPAPDQRDRSAHERWSKIINEPRFAIQSKRFQAASNRLPNNLLHSGRHRRLVTPQRDWQMNMYSAATTVARNGAGRYPVTWSLDPTAPACDSAAKPDYVAYNTGLVGSATTASIVAYDNLYKTTCAGPGPIPISVPLVYWQYNIMAGTITGSPLAI